MTRAGVDAGAALMMTAVASFITFFGGAKIAELDLLARAIAAILGIVGFYLVYEITHRFLSWLRFHKVLGRWIYVTASHANIEFQTGNYAYMRIYIGSDSELAYEVKLYNDFESACLGSGVGCDKKSKETLIESPSFGLAKSEAIRYDSDDKKLTILFDVKFHDADEIAVDRRGRLDLTLSESHQLHGSWVSDLNRMSISSGRMFALRAGKDTISQKSRFDAAVSAWKDAASKTQVVSQQG